MRKSFLMLTTALAVTMAASAQAGTGWYVGISGGANWVEDVRLGTLPATAYPYAGAVDEVFEFDTGWIVGANVGYKWASNWRAELELAYRSNEGDIIQLTFPAGDQGDNEVTQFTQMINVFYDFPITEKLTFSIGAGIGGNLVSYEDSNLGLGSFYTNPPNGLNYDDEYVLAGQVIAQVGYAVTNRLDVYLDYRYLVADEPEFVSTSAPVNGFTFEDDKHALMIGLRYDLVEDAAAPAPYTPPPYTPPPPPTAPKQFIVFFGFNKANLTSDAQRVVAEAAAAAKTNGSASILVTGHTDTVGSNRYNDRLSVRRATAVKDELVRQGIGAGMISAVGKGEMELMIQTGDNVKEPQNRRATIDLN
jgi:outer membrane protein OmpA-like peptidoglycan-associated protein